MDIVIYYFQQFLLLLIPFIILLGILIFVHEFGHFIVAKFFGVRVETFSLGFGKKIFQYFWRDTNYCISLVPLGGYVKMYGDDPTAEIPQEDKKISFLGKPVGQRILIVLAGPLMNLFFAIFLFFLIGYIGEERIKSVVGDIKINSEAYNLGFRSGDEIIKINDKKVDSWKDVQTLIKNSANKKIVFTILRKNEIYNKDFTEAYEIEMPQKLELEVKPKLIENPNILSLDDKVGGIEGLDFKSQSSMIAIYENNSILAQKGLKTGDLIFAINDKKIKYWRNLEKHLLDIFNNKVNSFTINYKRDEGTKGLKEKEINVNINNFPKDYSSFKKALGIDNPNIYLSKVIDDSPAKKAGLKEGDKIISIDGNKIFSWDEIVNIVGSYDSSKNNNLVFKIKRNDLIKEVVIKPELTNHMNMKGQEINKYTVGIYPYIDMAMPETFKQRYLNPITAGKNALVKSYDITMMTLVSILKLFQNKISPKNLGGVISIGQVASKTFQIGLSHFLQMMALISINLFILNLLPVPILDGGHLLFFTVELVKGSPLNIRTMEIAQQIGLIILIALMAFALFNDFARIFEFSW